MKRRDAFLTLGTAAVATMVGTSFANTGARQAASSIAHGFHARMKAKANLGDALVALLFEAPAFEHPDCKVFLIGRSQSDPGVVFVTEGWVDDASHARFSATEEAMSYTARFGSVVAEWTSSDEIPLGGKALLT